MNANIHFMLMLVVWPIQFNFTSLFPAGFHRMLISKFIERRTSFG